MTKNPWFIGKQNFVDLITLLCIPYAGGNASLYRNWQEQLGPRVNVQAVQLPGRATRISDPPHTNISVLVEEISNEMDKILNGRFAVFGHSMGALIAFELARFRRSRSLSQPENLILSGCPSPRCRELSARATHTLEDNDFIEKLREYNGTPPDVLAHAEMMKIMLPTIRADFELVHNYNPLKQPPLDIPITLLAGRSDSLSKEKILPWQEETMHPTKLHMLDGDHFFINDSFSEVMKIVRDELFGRDMPAY
jgi:surfactin synthase thioesterase subunit